MGDDHGLRTTDLARLHGMAEVDWLQCRQVVRLAGLEPRPGTFGEVARAPQVSRRGSREARGGAEQLPELCLGLVVDITTEEDWPIDIGAELGERDIPIIADTCPGLTVSKQRCREAVTPEAEERVNRKPGLPVLVGQQIGCGDADQWEAPRQRQPLGGADPDPQAAPASRT